MAKSRYSYKQLFYLVVILGFATFLVTYCTQKIVDPVIGKYTTPSKGFIFQKAQEERINTQLDLILKRLFGKDGYYVSVRAALRDTEESVEDFQLLPEVVTKNSGNSVEQSYNRQGRTQKQDASSVDEELLQEGELLGDGFLPGLVQSQRGSGGVNRSLPGFPLIEQDLPVVKKTSDNRLAFAGQEDFQGREDDSTESAFKVTNESHETELIVSKRNTKTITPITSIDRLVVSVVIDEKRYAREPVDLDKLKELISGVAGLNIDRGDEVQISVLPITHKLIDWYEVGKTIEQVKKTLSKYKTHFYVFIASLLGALLVWLILRLVKYMQIRKAARQLAEIESRKREAKTKEQEAEALFNNKRDEIVQITKQKPEQVAQLILNWVEKTGATEETDE